MVMYHGPFCVTRQPFCDAPGNPGTVYPIIIREDTAVPLRHVIIEGPDGAGKTMLRDSLLKDLPYFTTHERAAQSVAGPNLSTLEEWVVLDTNNLSVQRPSIYDRHPLVSEPVYGPIVRNNLSGHFAQPWWVKSMTHRVASHALLVLCMPPLEEVIRNVFKTPGDQMLGVTDHITRIYAEYSRVYHTWPGVLLRRDYTQTLYANTRDIIRRVTHA